MNFDQGLFQAATSESADKTRLQKCAYWFNLTIRMFVLAFIIVKQDWPIIPLKWYCFFKKANPVFSAQRQLLISAFLRIMCDTRGEKTSNDDETEVIAFSHVNVIGYVTGVSCGCLPLIKTTTTSEGKQPLFRDSERMDDQLMWHHVPYSQMLHYSTYLMHLCNFIRNAPKVSLDSFWKELKGNWRTHYRKYINETFSLPKCLQWYSTTYIPFTAEMYEMPFFHASSSRREIEKKFPNRITNDVASLAYRYLLDADTLEKIAITDAENLYAFLKDKTEELGKRITASRSSKNSKDASNQKVPENKRRKVG